MRVCWNEYLLYFSYLIQYLQLAKFKFELVHEIVVLAAQVTNHGVQRRMISVVNYFVFLQFHRHLSYFRKDFKNAVCS